MPSNIKTLVLFCLCFALGLSLFFSISEEMIIQRDPAAIHGKIYQISTLSSEQIKKQLTNKIRVSSIIDGQKTIRLEGLSSALCKSYSELEIEFVADGVAVAGVAPTMTVKAPCEAAQDPAEMASVTIPYARILAEKPRNAEFRFDGFASRIEFKNASDEWPRTWILKSIHFTPKSGVADKHVRLDTNEDGDLKSPSELTVLEF